MEGAGARVDAWGDPIGPRVLPPLVRVAEPRALEICLRTPLSAEAKGLLRPEHSPAEYLHELLSKPSYSDAAHFLAQALPKPLAVRWARDAAFAAEEFDAREEVKEAFALIEAWLEACEGRGIEDEGAEGAEDPRVALRAKAAELAEALAFKPPSAWVLMAIAQSVPAEGADKPELYRPMTGQCAATAVVLAAASFGEPLIMDHDDQYIALLQGSLARAVHLAAGGEGEPDPDLLEPYFLDDDPVLGRQKERVLDLESLMAHADRAASGELAREPAQELDDEDGVTKELRLPPARGGEDV